MLYITAQSKGSYASAYMQEAVWKKNNSFKELVYARIAGKPAFVKAIAAILMRGEHITTIHEERTKWLFGIKNSKCLYHRIDKIAIATYYCKELFNHYTPSTILVGRNQIDIQNALKAIAKKKPILLHEEWDIKEILSEKNLLIPLGSYKIQGYEILWNTEEINEHISNLVKQKKLTF